MFLRRTSIRYFSSTPSLKTDHYQILNVPHTASVKDIKVQFRKLSKKYHPDLNGNLSVEEKEVNHTRFVKIVGAYDVLKDIKKRKEYDMKLRLGGESQATQTPRSSPRSEWQNQYYGEAKYYSKTGSTHSASGLNSKRNKIYFNEGSSPSSSSFSGKHMNYGDRYDVPHFNYDEHLHRNLKFEQRIINKHISPEDREKILSQLNKSGEKLSEELITKHLMRHIHHSNYSENITRTSENSHSLAKNPYMYHGPQSNYGGEEGSGVFKLFMFLGGATSSMFLLYNLLK